MIVRAGNLWTVPGGGVEQGENIVDATRREISEETNMKMLKHKFMFFQTFHRPNKKIMYQILSVCLVEPEGDFISDTDNDVEEIKLIEPMEFDKDINWNDNDPFIKKARDAKQQMECK